MRALFRQTRRALITVSAVSVLFSASLMPTASAANQCGYSVPVAGSIPTSVVKATPITMPTISLNGLISDLNYTVNSLNQSVCGQMFVGGRFVSAYSADGKTSYARNGIFAFNAATGAVNTVFHPKLTGSSVDVYSVLSTSDGRAVYIGGTFTGVDGKANTSYLVKYDVLNNCVDTSFNARVNNQVNSLALWNGKLIVGGNFTTAGGVNETALAALDPTTGANTGYFSKLVIAGTQPSATAGPTRVKTIAVSPTATLEAVTGLTVQHLVIAGNWSTVGGVSRGQIAMLSLGSSAAVSSWDATILHMLADPRFGNYLRGVSFMPDGSAFFLAASGSYWPSNGPNDAVLRFEMKVTGALVTPTWINKTGGDSLWTVVATPGAVYITGHERWANNPLCIDAQGTGRVSRPGIGAIDHKTGMALSWNPTRSRAVGGTALLVTPAGLWVGSDGPQLGCTTPGGVNHDDCNAQPMQNHAGIGFLPY